LRGDVSLNDIVDVFSCCVLNWEAFTVMLPAFVMAGAIAVFVPPPVLLRYFGPSAPKPLAYGVAAVSGCLLAVCSCNIVPLFISIYRRGAGLGPAMTFLYCGPAVNIVSLVFVYQVIGWRLGLWRMLAVPVIGILIGLFMSLLFRKEEAQRHQAATRTATVMLEARPTKRVATLLGLVFAIMLVGSWKQQEMAFLTWPVKIALMLGLAGIAVCLVVGWFEPEDLKDWGKETGKLILTVVPVLLVSVLVIGYLARAVDLRLLQKIGFTSRGGGVSPSHFVLAIGALGSGSGMASAAFAAVAVGPREVAAYVLTALCHPPPALVASAFGSFMYFPMLSEVAFVKAFLKLNDMPAYLGLIILLTGPGLSLPGMILVGMKVGLKKTAAYVTTIIILAAATGYLFQAYIGKYVCACTTGKPDPFPLWEILGRLF